MKRSITADKTCVYKCVWKIGLSVDMLEASFEDDIEIFQ